MLTKKHARDEAIVAAKDLDVRHMKFIRARGPKNNIQESAITATCWSELCGKVKAKALRMSGSNTEAQD